MNKSQVAVIFIWVYMTIGIWSTLYFQTKISPTIFTIIGFAFVLFAILGVSE